MAEGKWKLESDLCRCCLNEGSHKNLAKPNFNITSGETEVYADMLLENIGLNLLPVDGVLSAVTYTICEPCIDQLRGVQYFKKQVQITEEKFWDLYKKNVFRTSASVVVKEEEVENPEPPDYRGDGDNDGINIDDFSDEDTKLNLIEIKAESLKIKGKTKAKPRKRAKMTPTRRKASARKTTDKATGKATGKATLKTYPSAAKVKTIKKEEGDEDEAEDAAEDAEAEDAEPPAKKAKDDPESEVPLTTAVNRNIASDVTQHSCVTLNPVCTLNLSSAEEYDPTNIKAEEKLGGHRSSITQRHAIDSYGCMSHQSGVVKNKKATEKNPNKKRSKKPAKTNTKKPIHDYKNVYGKFQCGDCGKTFKTKDSIRSHYNHHKLRKCKHCELQFNKYKMPYHVQSAHGIAMPTCGICGFQHMAQSKVDEHQKQVHMKEKNFKCDQCELTFFSNSLLRRHQRTHTNERQFECDFCHKKFKTSGTMTLHRKIHTGEKDKVCPVCAQGFVQKASLNYHMAKYHPGTKF